MTTVNAKPHKHLRRLIAVGARWLHIYLSVFSFGVVLFFAVTGLTLNHPDWTQDRAVTTARKGAADTKLLHAPGVDGADKLGLVEMLRSKEGVHGAVSDFRVDGAQISISFRAPGYSADAFIDRGTGKYDLTIVNNGFIALINDLHKGRDSGKPWAGLIDVSAVLLVLVSATGLLLVWFILKRRFSGLVVTAIGIVAVVVFYHFFVP